MNNTRRKAIEEIRDRLAEISDEIDEILGEEEEYRDNIPENLQGGERYERAEEAVSNLSSATDSLYEVLDYLESAVE